MLEEVPKYARMCLPVVVIGLFVYVSQYNYIGGDLLRQHTENVTPSEADNLFPNYHYFTKFKPNKLLNCKAIIQNDTYEIRRSIYTTEGLVRTATSPEEYINATSTCSNFIEKRGYIMQPLTMLEEEFPIAYSILAFKDVEQFERLLRSIYRPQNIYCIHVDIKSVDEVFNAIKRIASCFSNVFLSSQRVSVQWGSFTVLEADLICTRDLWKDKTKWRYFINLTGQEFPLRTNYELVQILTQYNGANDVSVTRKSANKDRWSEAGTPPHDIVPAKGSVHVALSRAFVDFMLHDNRSLDFLEWLKFTGIPDETYFPTLNHSPHLGAPGSYAGESETTSNDTKPFVVRFKNWGDSIYDWPCGGFRVRSVCVFGTSDLPLLSQRKEIFANKFYWNFQNALDCMEELIFNRTRDQYLGKVSFDPSWYGQLGFVKDHIKREIA